MTTSSPEGRPARPSEPTLRRRLVRLLSATWLAVLLTGVPGMAAAAPGTAGANGAAAASRWQWPLRPPPDQVVHGFAAPDDRWGSGHRGVDLLGTRGDDVHAAGAGVVTYAGLLAGLGVVTVTHGPLRTTYEPVTPAVAAGDHVDAGDVIGTLDLIGGHCLPRACLHWGLLRGEAYLHPLSVVGDGPVRLLPLPDLAPSRPGASGPVTRPATTPAPVSGGPAKAARASPPRHRAVPAAAAVGVLAAGAAGVVVLRRRRLRQ